MVAAIGSASAATPITTCTELQNIKNSLSGDYYLDNDIDCSDTVNWNGGAGFEPIGINFNGFTGTFDGQGHKIANLYINRPSSGCVGLFGCLENSGSEVKNVGLGNVTVHGGFRVGGLVGWNDGGTINNSYSTGDVSCSATSWYVGGLVGWNDGTINNSYSTASANGGYYVGGLVGLNGGPVSNSYSTGSVTGDPRMAGGFVGAGDCNNCYWDTQTSGQSTSACGTGKTTAEMKQQATFAGWDFDNIWTIEEDVTRPVHQWQPRQRPVKPFLVSGYVNHSSGNPLIGPNVTITNMVTGEVFVVKTNESSNYYQVITSSWNVIAWDMLHFNATNSNSTEFDHSVTGDEINNGGFRQDIVIDNPDTPDTDGDGVLDDADNCRLTPNSEQQDTDGDGYGNICDCDLNNDDRVNMMDFNIFRDAWGTTSTDPNYNADADFDSNGYINMMDFMIFRGRWLSTAPWE